MKNINFEKLTLAVAAVLAISSLAAAQQPLAIDDFSTGQYSKVLKTGSDTHTVTGTMLGGSRTTIFVSCPSVHCSGGGQGDNPYDQPNSFDVKPLGKSKGIVILNSAYRTEVMLNLGYGYGSPMNEPLSPTYDRIRLNFDGSNQNINTNIYAGFEEESAFGCWIVPPQFMQPFSVDFPFADFSDPTVFGGLTILNVVFGASEGLNAEMEFGVTSIQAIPIGAAKADITCN
jgi:hypothetical protein